MIGSRNNENENAKKYEHHLTRAHGRCPGCRQRHSLDYKIVLSFVLIDPRQVQVDIWSSGTN